MIILGIDPGFGRVGYGAVRMESSKYQHMGNGTIETSSKDTFEKRLETIFNCVTQMIEKCYPDAIAIEKLYFQNNQKTAIDVAQARGVILLAARLSNVPIFEYTPLEVKTIITGYGRAQKHQIIYMVKKLLNLKEMPKYDDAADALAIALCHAQTAKRRNLFNKLKGDVNDIQP